MCVCVSTGDRMMTVTRIKSVRETVIFFRFVFTFRLEFVYMYGHNVTRPFVAPVTATVVSDNSCPTCSLPPCHSRYSVPEGEHAKSVLYYYIVYFILLCLRVQCDRMILKLNKRRQPCAHNVHIIITWRPGSKSEKL